VIGQWICDRLDEFRRCGHGTAKLVLAGLSALVSAICLRWGAFVVAAVMPAESWAARLAERAMDLALLDFAIACVAAAVGGVASLFHELRADLTRFSFINAFGHMVLAQFAGMLVFLVSVQYGWQYPIAVFSCAVSGWGGNRTVIALNDAFMRRVGMIDMSERKP
jgi:hypothetical protein